MSEDVSKCRYCGRVLSGRYTTPTVTTYSHSVDYFCKERAKSELDERLLGAKPRWQRALELIEQAEWRLKAAEAELV